VAEKFTFPELSVDGLAKGFDLDFEKPPLLIRTDRSKTVGYLAVAVLLIIFFAFGPYRQTPSWLAFLFHALSCFFLLCALLGVVILIRPGSLEIGRDEINYSSIFWNRKYFWRDITDVQYRKFWDGGYGSAYWIVFSLRPGHEKVRRQFGVGEDMAIIEGRGWPMSAEELFEILAECRRRWSPKAL
jgi:hypothetical protein